MRDDVESRAPCTAGKHVRRDRRRHRALAGGAWPRSAFGTLVLAILAIEGLIRAGVINRFIVPLPSQVALAFGRVITEEDLGERFRLTFLEAFTAGVLMTVVGVALGILLYRVFNLLRRATETWVAALASAPTVLMYPLFLVIFGRNAWTIIMMGFVAGLPPVILKTVEGLSGTRRVLIDVGRSLKLTGLQMYLKILFPAALPTIFVGVRLGLIFTLINVVGVEFLINFGGLGQLINDLAERYDPSPGTYAAICFVILVSVCFFVPLRNGSSDGWDAGRMSAARRRRRCRGSIRSRCCGSRSSPACWCSGKPWRAPGCSIATWCPRCSRSVPRSQSCSRPPTSTGTSG